MDIYSPCIRVCVLIEDTCVGCQRTITEIAGWSTMNDDEKLNVLDRTSFKCGGNGTNPEQKDG